jgi:hypothetical protein
MSTYMVELSHKQEECLHILDEMKNEDLQWWQFGCESGVHTGWGIVEAANEAEARKIVPEFIRNRVQVVRVTRMTPEHIREIHRMAVH